MNNQNDSARPVTGIGEEAPRDAGQRDGNAKPVIWRSMSDRICERCRSRYMPLLGNCICRNGN